MGAGFGFLPTLYTYGILLGIFAWPAGLGDMAIGVSAPLVLSALLRQPDFAASKSFVAWNLSGILDLTVAVSIGALVPLLAPNLYGAVSTAPMAQLPLVLVPTYLVPTFLIITHLTATSFRRGVSAEKQIAKLQSWRSRGQRYGSNRIRCPTGSPALRLQQQPRPRTALTGI